MKTILGTIFGLLMGLQAQAGGISHQTSDATNGNPLMSFTAPTLTTIVSFDKWGNMPKNIIVEAYEDAQMNVASEGQIKGAYLERALHMVRETTQTTATDYEMALEIVMMVQASAGQ